MQIGPAKVGWTISEWGYVIAKFWNPAFRCDAGNEDWDNYDRERLGIL